MKKNAKSPANGFRYTVGSDPELMLRNRNTGEIVSAIDVLKRGKEDKISLGGGFVVYYDNVLAETNVPPAFTGEEFVTNTKETLARIQNHLGANHELVAQASHVFPAEAMQHEAARVFGCNPEFCAYTFDTLTPPATDSFLRTCGGHIHIGRDDFKKHLKDKDGVFLMDDMSKINVIRVFDILVGLPIAIMDNDPTSPARKELYGRAGRHRPTDYGVEYRTPGNFWLSNPEAVNLIFDLSVHAAGVVERNEQDAFYEAAPSEEVIEAVNTNNKEEAARLLSKVTLPDGLRARIKAMAKTPVTPLTESWNLA